MIFNMIKEFFIEREILNFNKPFIPLFNYYNTRKDKIFGLYKKFFFFLLKNKLFLIKLYIYIYIFFFFTI